MKINNALILMNISLFCSTIVGMESTGEKLSRPQKISRFADCLVQHIKKGEQDGVFNCITLIRKYRARVETLQAKDSGMSPLHYAVLHRMADENFKKAFSEDSFDHCMPIRCAEKSACVIEEILRASNSETKNFEGNTALHLLIGNMQCEEDVLLAQYLARLPYETEKFYSVRNNQKKTCMDLLKEKARENSFNEKLLNIIEGDDQLSFYDRITERCVAL